MLDVLVYRRTPSGGPPDLGVHGEARFIIHRLPVRRETHHDIFRVQEPEVVLRAVNHSPSQVCIGQHVKHHSNIKERCSNQLSIALRTAEGEVIVCRNIATVRDFGVIIKLYLRKGVHDVVMPCIVSIHGDGFPANVGRTVESEHRGQSCLACALHGAPDLLDELLHEASAILEEIAGLGDTRSLHIAEPSHA